ncbi:MAG: extracellular solute-binding protein [Kiritimatiellaeota bacterium]|nr:extracellular solute-binding protein [Kiritimatiellota bacterium]
MPKRLGYVVLMLLVVALPLLLRRAPTAGTGRAGDPELVIITPHNEAIRYEFGRAFSAWHQQKYGRAVRVDWRVIGGTTEISRYLQAQYAAAVGAWWRQQQRTWPVGMADRLFDSSLDAPAAKLASGDRALAEVRQAFLKTDAASAFSCGIDVFFGGGSFDHGDAARKGFTVSLEPVLKAVGDLTLLPEQVSGEIWRTTHFAGNALSLFGICYNLDRLRDLGAPPPAQWVDLTHPRFVGQLGLTDPTKSGSAAKAFEMIIQQQCRLALHAADFTDAESSFYERIIAGSKTTPGTLPQGVPQAYQRAIEDGWRRGVALIQLLGANARYFTDSSSRVPLDVSQGDATAGICIDFFARFQAAQDHAPGAPPRMAFVAPVGGTSVTSDPISLLRGAEHRELAERFIAYTLSPAGQRLWIARPGTPGGPERYALWRLPIRRDFYPSEDPVLQQRFAEEHQYTAFDLGAPENNVFVLATNFTYEARWTGKHFGVHRDLIKAMCLDSGHELRAAWRAILAHGGPAAQPEAMRLLALLPDQPETLTWTSALDIAKRHDRLDYLRAWTDCYRRNYRLAQQAAEARD